MGLSRLTRNVLVALVTLTAACATAPSERPPIDESVTGGGATTLPDGAPVGPGTLPDGAPAPRSDGGATLPDGAPITLPDGGPAPTARVSCGGTFCRADQTCNSGSCSFPCTGTNVPGDYATLANAVSALAPTGGTICLKAQAYPETVTVSGTAGKTLTIVGPNAADTKVNTLYVSSGYDAVSLRGISGTFYANGRSKMDAIGLAGSVYVQSNGPQEIRLDGVNLGGSAASPSSYGLYVYPQNGGSPKVTVTSSYIHDATYGVYIYGYYGASEVTVLNSTFSGNDTGISVTSASYSPTLTYSNNLFVNHKSFAISLATAPTQLTHENNLLFGNANNYSGSAADGAGYLKVDPNLDNASPPEPKPGSPARGSALGTRAPALDYYGVARGGGADRGAVQGM